MELQYLDFDFSGDPEGHGSFDAMASAGPAQQAALEREVVAVLAWAQRAFGPAGALEEGGEWDYALHAVREVATPMAVHWQPGATALAFAPGPADPPRVTLTLTLTLTGTPAFCEALREAFAIG